MKSRVAYGPGRGLKKPRGPRAKARIRWAAEVKAYALALRPRVGSSEVLRRARWATVRAGGKWRDLRRIEPSVARGVVTFWFRAGCDALAARVADAMFDVLPCYVTAVWDCES